MSDWWRETHRKIHILYVSPPWAAHRGERFDAASWARQIKDAHITSLELYCKDHHGVCYYPSTLGLDYPRDVVGELFDAAKAEGLRFVAYYSVGYDAYALGVHPDWMQIDENGRPFQYRPFFHACMNSPYRQFALEQLDELCRHRRFDAIWLDIVSFIFKTPDHAGRHLGTPCYCVYCRRLYRARFGRPLPLAPSLDERLSIYRWQVENLRGWLDDAYRTIRAATASHGQGDGIVITYNGAGGWHDPIDSASLTSIEAHAPQYQRQSFTARWSRSKGKPFEVLTPGGLPGASGGWDSWDQKPYDALAVEQAVVVAQGGSQVFGVVPYADGWLDAAQLSQLGRVFEHTEAIEPYAHAASSVAQVAILLAARQNDAPHLWTDALNGALSWHGALSAGHVLFDVIPSVEGIDRYDLVIVPDAIALTAQSIAALRRFSDRGGRLIVTGRSAFLDPAGRTLGKTELSDALGIDHHAQSEHVFAYLRITDSALSTGIPAVPILAKQRPIEIGLAGAESLVDLELPETAYGDPTTMLWGYPPPDPRQSRPAVTRRAHGQGEVVYIALALDTRGFENALTRRLAINLVDRLLGHRLIEVDAPPTLEVVVNRQPGRLVAHLIDHASGDLTYGVAQESRGRLMVTLRFDAMRFGRLFDARIVTGGAMALRREGDQALVDVPIDAPHTVVVLATG